MPRAKKDSLGKQDGKSNSNNKTVVRATRKQAVVPSNVKIPASKTTNHNHLQCSTVARPTATVPPNNTSLPANSLASITNGPTVISVTSAPIIPSRSLMIFPSRSLRTPVQSNFQNPQVHLFRLPSSTSGSIGVHSGSQENDDVTYLYTVDSSPTQRLAEEVDLTQEAEDRSENPENDNVTYLYTVDSIPAHRLVDEVDLTQETEVENPAPIKKTVTKAQKNRKRKVEEVEIMSKRNKIVDAQPMCSLCDIHNDSLIEIAEHMLLGSCGHLFCAPCTRNLKVNDCEICGKKINALRKVFF